MTLSKKSCIPCKGGTPALKGREIEHLKKQLGGNWETVKDHHLKKEYSFPNFKTALVFVNKIGEIAEREGHHPDIALSWGKVGLELWTHKAGGLTENDFILAAKCDEAYG